MPFPVTINGNPYQESDFAPYGYVTNFPGIMQDMADTAAAAAASALKLVGSSTSSVTIGLGTKSFTTQAAKFFDPGVHVQLTSNAGPAVDYMFGVVTAYSGT